MKKFRLFQLNDKGASLIAVLVAIVVVGVMGSVVMQLTITNLQMKEVERQGKTNFYSAEDFMGYLTNQINVQSAKELQDAFNDMLASYGIASESSMSLKKSFSKAYLDKMIAFFQVAGDTPSQKKSGEEVLYEVGHYDNDILQGLIYTPVAPVQDIVPPALKNDRVKYGFEASSDSYYHADYENGTFTIDNVCVFAKDDFGNITKIQTDLVFHVPDINLDGSNVVKEFMRYSLIADKKIDLYTINFTVDGNVYAGEDGIVCESDMYGSLKGKKIITRGDIQAKSSDGKFYVGNSDNSSYSQIWANNYVTLADSNKGAKLFISGDSYIADDLSVNGRNDLVVIQGGYYGYNFQENYGAVESTVNSEFSSSILINGKDSFIDVSDVTRFVVAGRGFVGRNKNVASGSNDILMGESISVKANQIAYYVPADCMVGGTFNASSYELYSGISDVYAYVNAADPVTEYHYRDVSGTETTIYYLKFKSEQSANLFFADYYAIKKDSMMAKARNYIKGGTRSVNLVQEDGSTVTVEHFPLQITLENAPTFHGDFIYTDASGNLAEGLQNINPGLWGYGDTYFDFATDHAIRYKSMMLTLEDVKDASMRGNVRLEATDPTLFHNLIDDVQWSGFFVRRASEPYMTDGYKYEKAWKERESDPDGTVLLAIIDNATRGTYTVPSGYDSGLIIASGDVQVTKDFEGTIISGGVITVDGAGCTITSNEVLISKMISRDALLRTDAIFANLFKGYSEAAEEIMTGSNIEKYMTFDNWTKTIE